MPLKAHIVNVVHLATTDRSQEPRRSFAQASQTAYCAQTRSKKGTVFWWDLDPTATNASGKHLGGHRLIKYKV